jgi:hypothetical protein
MGAPPIRSSDIPLFSGAIGSPSTAGFVLPARNGGLTEPLPSRRGSFFATHLRTSHLNLPSGGAKPNECQQPRIATASHSSPAGELDRTAVEVAEFLAHLFEREPEGKKAPRGVDWQTERQTLVAKRGDHPGAFIEGGFGCLGFEGGQRVRASAQVIGCAFRDAQEQRLATINLRERNARLLDVLERKATSPTINNVVEACIFLGQPFRECLRAQP